jgi:hypothetical protein
LAPPAADVIIVIAIGIAVRVVRAAIAPEPGRVWRFVDLVTLC